MSEKDLLFSCSEFLINNSFSISFFFSAIPCDYSLRLFYLTYSLILYENGEFYNSSTLPRIFDVHALRGLSLERISKLNLHNAYCGSEKCISE